MQYARTYNTTYRSSPADEVAEPVADGPLRLERHDVRSPFEEDSLAIRQKQGFAKIPVRGTGI